MLEQRIVTDEKTGGKKGLSADRYDLIPAKALEYLALIYGVSCTEHGGKYEPRNWEKGYPWSRTIRALLKHVMAVVRGGWLDPDSGLPHIMHAAWHCFTLCTYYDYKLGTDDRTTLREPDERRVDFDKLFAVNHQAQQKVMDVVPRFMIPCKFAKAARQPWTKDCPDCNP